MLESISNSLLNALQRNVFPVTAIEPYEGSWRVDFSAEATAEQMELTWEFIRNWIPPEQPDWSAFRLALLSNPAYKRSTLVISATMAGVLLVQRLENAAAMNEPPVDVIVMLWNSMVKNLPKTQAIAPEEVEQWRAISAAAHVPLKFEDGGFLSAHDS
jgi:hypothetical protein